MTGKKTRAGPAAALAPLRALVKGWFQARALQSLLSAAPEPVGRLAVNWMARGGNRWRPLLLCAAQRALAGPASLNPDTLRRLAVAVECFHKASLIHDDIEDGDDWRDGYPALHAAAGIPQAVNAGDYLLGEGYRLIADSALPAAIRVRMCAAAAAAHRALCLGQGRELAWRSRPAALSSAAVRDIFRLKTAPGFEVALRLGALAAGAPEQTYPALSRFSAALGCAYQIRDDLKDETSAHAKGVPAPSLLRALSSERAVSVAARRAARRLFHDQLADAADALAQLDQPRLRNALRAFLACVFRAG
jgi:geranylgeranyl pyrophosphate synthase